jgi:LAGLIDADG endonuclease
MGMLPSRTDLAWAAGFFDGEGCVSVYMPLTKNRRARLRLNIKQKDPRPLVRFRRVVTFGRVYYFENPHRYIYEYAIGSFDQIQAVVAMLWPFLLGPKREQIVRKFRELHHAWRDASVMPRGPYWKATVFGWSRSCMPSPSRAPAPSREDDGDV